MKSIHERVRAQIEKRERDAARALYGFDEIFHAWADENKGVHG